MGYTSYKATRKEITNTAIQKVKDSIHVVHNKQRLAASLDPYRKCYLLDCFKAMYSNFKLPRQWYPEFQQAWFPHIGQYIDGYRGLGTPSFEMPSDRKINDMGQMTVQKASNCVRHLHRHY